MRSQSAVLAAVFVSLITVAVCVSAADTDEFTLERFLEVPTLGSPTLSADGSRLAYTIVRRDLEADEYRRQLWLADVQSGDTYRLTFDGGRVSGLDWRPDGALSFLRTHDGATQLWINPLDGSEPRPVTDMPDGLSAYSWSPDGLFVAALAPPAEEEDAIEPDERADWEVRDRLEHPEDYDQVWLVPVGTQCPAEGEARQLTHAPMHPYAAAWSPDGGTLAVTYNEGFSSLIDEEQRIGLLNVESGEMRMISDPDRHASEPAWSAAGERLAFFSDRQDDYRTYLNDKDLMIYSLAEGTTRNLTEGTPICLGGSGSTPQGAPVWSQNAKTLYVRGAEGRDLDLYAVDVRKGSIRKMERPGGNMVAVDVSNDVVAYIESERHRPGSLWAASIGKLKKPRLIHSTDDAVAAYDLRPAIPIELPGNDGVVVEGFLYLPPGADMQGRHPTIIEMHGGPFSRYGNAWTSRYPWQILSRNGFAVFIANPRGGTGYGQDFRRGVYRNFGTDDFLDLMAATGALINRGIADADRLGFTGYSYGGLMTNSVISRTDRFKAAVSIAGIFNYVSAMGQSNPQLFIDSYDQPWAGDLQLMWEHSPASRASAISTPTLVMHGTDDEPVDPRQSIELFSYMQLNDVPSRLVLYPGEGHGINRPSHMIDYQRRELDWFRHYLMGDAEAEGAAPPAPVEKTRR